MTSRTETLKLTLESVLGDRAASITEDKGQLIIALKSADLLASMTELRDNASLSFKQMIDCCGVDYSGYGDNWDGARFAVVYQLLSVEHNWRLRVRAFCADDDLPIIDSVTPIWSSANWYEREAFDLYGIVFNGHNDLRRILTDYGFVGHPFRKDFPVSGNVEMRYDPEQKRVVYQPVTIEPREVVPRVIREEHYAERK